MALKKQRSPKHLLQNMYNMLDKKIHEIDEEAIMKNCVKEKMDAINSC